MVDPGVHAAAKHRLPSGYLASNHIPAQLLLSTSAPQDCDRVPLTTNSHSTCMQEGITPRQGLSGCLSWSWRITAAALPCRRWQCVSLSLHLPDTTPNHTTLTAALTSPLTPYDQRYSLLLPRSLKLGTLGFDVPDATTKVTLKWPCTWRCLLTRALRLCHTSHVAPSASGCCTSNILLHASITHSRVQRAGIPLNLTPTLTHGVLPSSSSQTKCREIPPHCTLSTKPNLQSRKNNSL